MSKLTKFFLLTTMFSLLVPISLTLYNQIQKVNAAAAVKVELGCTKNPTYSIQDINNFRSHGGDNSGFAVDLNNNHECSGNLARASVPGRVSFVGYSSFYCKDLGQTVNNSLITIEGPNGIVIKYYHNNINASNTVAQGSVVQPGQVIGTIGAVGCAIGDHIHYEVWQHGNKLNYSQWEFVEKYNENPQNLRRVSSIVFKDMLVQTVTNKDGVVYTRFKNNNTPFDNPAKGWGAWEVSGGTYYKPTFVVKGEYLYQFIIGTEGRIYYRYTIGKIKNGSFKWIRNWTLIEDQKYFISDPVVTIFNNRIVFTANRKDDTNIIVLEFKTGLLGELHGLGPASEVGVANRNTSFAKVFTRLFQFLTGKEGKLYYRFTTGVNATTKLNTWSDWFSEDILKTGIESDISAVAIKVTETQYKLFVSYVKFGGEVWNLVFTLKNSNPSLGQAKLVEQHEGSLALGETSLLLEGNKVHQFILGLNNKVYRRIFQNGVFGKIKEFSGASKSDVEAVIYEGQIHLAILYNDPNVDHVYSRTFLSTDWKKSGELN